MLWKSTIILVVLLVTLMRNSTALDPEDVANEDVANEDVGGGEVDDNETEDGGEKEEEKSGKPLKASGLDIEVNKRLGSAMFTMMAEGNNQSSMSFGLAKIFEVDSAGNDIDEVKHVCKFDKDLKDNVLVLCEDEESEEGNFAGLDENGNKTDIPYVVATRKCPLASCQAESAMITIKSYIIKSKGFICQPDCEDTGDENRTVLQSPVFNGTAKWDIVVSGWEFCDSCGENSDTVAERLKIFFTVDGKSKGKSTHPIKKKPKEFNWQDCEIKAGWSKKEDFEDLDDDNESDDQAKKGPDGKTDEDKKIKGKGKPKKMKGKCKPARSTSFNGKPEDQDIIGFTGDDGLNATMTFRMYPMAVIDDSEVIGTDTGFEGPNVEEIEETLADENEKKTKRYMVITVKKFKNKMVYDPTGDMEETGGIALAGFSPAISLSLFIMAAVFLNAMF